MEHLLLPRGATIADAERAPFVAEGYDGGPFLDYPQRSRFKSLYERILPRAEPFWGDNTYDDAEIGALETFMQTWLIFGLLHEIFGDSISPKDFCDVHTDCNQKYFTTVRLTEIVDQWVASQDANWQSSEN